mgnify:CR=1 FL=1
MRYGAPERILVHENEREWGNWKSDFKTAGQPAGIHFIPLNRVGYTASLFRHCNLSTIIRHGRRLFDPLGNTYVYRTFYGRFRLNLQIHAKGIRIMRVLRGGGIGNTQMDMLPILRISD